MESIEWSALEYEEKNRERSWFWALGVIVCTSSAAAFLYGNYFFGSFLILGGGMLGYLAIRKPDLVFYKLSQKGFHIGNNLYPYENIRSFWVQREAHGALELRPLLFLHTERFFLPVVVAPIEDAMGDRIRDFLLDKNIAEEEMKEHISEKIMEALGF